MLKKPHAMNKFLALLVLLLLPLAGHAQFAEVLNLDMYIWELGSQCPYEFEEGWSITSVYAVGDTVTLELETPSLLGAYLPTLTDVTTHADKIKVLWVDHVSHYGQTWKDLLELMSQERRWFLLALRPQGGKKVSTLLVAPEELGTILAKD
jgi:hypothetical protein